MANALSQVVEKFNKLPLSAQQTLLGSVSGYATGYTLVKFGKSVGLSVGATIMLLQIGYKFGYISIDWNTMNRDFQKAKEEVEKQAKNIHIPELGSQMHDIIKDNFLTVSSFVGGFFIGFSSA